MAVIPFSWYGGKASKLKWLLPLLPMEHTFVDVFGGSASVTLNRPPAKVETYNDLNSDVVRFFRVCRERKDELIEKIDLTPYSKEEYDLACKGAPVDDDVEMARRFFVKVNCSFGSRGCGIPTAFGRSISHSRKGMSSVVSKFETKKRYLSAICDRFRRIHIENDDAIVVMKRYDTESTLLYCDPPYLHETRSKGSLNVYMYEPTRDWFVEFFRAANECNGKVAISNYDHEFFEEMLPRDKWVRSYDRERVCTVNSITRTARQDVLFTNYDPCGKLSLPFGLEA